MPTPLIANPASDADEQSHLQVVAQLVRLTSKAMSNRPSRKRLRVLSQNSDKVLMRVALMQKKRLTDTRCNFQLTRKGRALHVAWRKVTEVVEAALADCDDLRQAGEGIELFGQLISELGCVMRVNARRGEEPSRMCVCQRHGLPGSVTTGAGDNHLDDADSRRASHHGIAVAVITIVGKVDANVD